MGLKSISKSINPVLLPPKGVILTMCSEPQHLESWCRSVNHFLGNYPYPIVIFYFRGETSANRLLASAKKLCHASSVTILEVDDSVPPAVDISKV